MQRPTCREPPRAQKLTNGVRAETKQNNENIPEERTERRTAYAESLNEIDKYEIDWSLDRFKKKQIDKKKDSYEID